jgi:hypothetical protein
MYVCCRLNPVIFTIKGDSDVAVIVGPLFKEKSETIVKLLALVNPFVIISFLRNY